MKKHIDVYCPKCFEKIWDFSFVTKLHKCWNCFLAFDVGLSKAEKDSKGENQMEKIVQLKRHEAVVRQAVNSHEELVHALKFTRNVIDNACGQLTGNEAKLIYNMVIKALKTLEVKS